MGLFQFGGQDRFACIVDVPIKGSAMGENLCLAHKTMTYWVGFPAYLRDDGYVLKPRSSQGMYYPLTTAQIATHQAAGELPAPLPKYEITLSDYAGSYCLWWIIALAVIVTVVRNKTKRRRAADA